MENHIPSHSKRVPWTSAEDQALLQEAQNFGCKHWVFVSKRMGKRFPALRTPDQCRKRAAWLQKKINSLQPWSPNEECVLLLAYYKSFGRWKSIYVCLKHRQKRDIKTHFHVLLWEIAQKITAGTASFTSPTDKFAALVVSCLAISWIENDARFHLDRLAGKNLRLSKLTVVQCLQATKPNAMLSPVIKAWTTQTLRRYLENAAKNLENAMLSQSQSLLFDATKPCAAVPEVKTGPEKVEQDSEELKKEYPLSALRAIQCGFQKQQQPKMIGEVIHKANS